MSGCRRASLKVKCQMKLFLLESILEIHAPWKNCVVLWSYLERASCRCGGVGVESSGAGGPGENGARDVAEANRPSRRSVRAIAAWVPGMDCRQ